MPAQMCYSVDMHTKKETANFLANASFLCDRTTRKLVAERAGLAPANMTRTLRGRAMPSLAMAESIAGALGYSLAALLVDPKRFEAKYLAARVG